MPDSSSMERRILLRSLGAELILAGVSSLWLLFMCMHSTPPLFSLLWVVGIKCDSFQLQQVISYTGDSHFATVNF
jgi:hypothetical protein